MKIEPVVCIANKLKSICVHYFGPNTVKPPIRGQTACPLPLTVHTFLPPMKGQPPNNGQNACSHHVHYSEVPLYTI